MYTRNVGTLPAAAHSPIGITQGGGYVMRNIRQCQVCNAPFRTYLSIQQRGQGRFCSPSCWGKSLVHTEKDFWARVNQCAHGVLCLYCCWPWTLSDIARYGRHGDKGTGTHRTAWKLHNKQSIPPGKVVAHYCHNKMCCNPLHLHMGTHKDNKRDEINDNRTRKGSKHHKAKLQESDISAIFSYRESGLRHWEIAKIYEMSRSNISDILRQKTWSHVKER